MMATPGPYVRFILLFISVLLLQACHTSFHAVQHTPEVYTVGQESGVDSSLVRLLQPYKQGVDTQMNVVIGYTDISLTKAQPESTLGNFLADALLEGAGKAGYKAEAAIVNYGSLRLPYINPGPLTTGKLFELMPFDNVVVIVEIPGAELRRFCTEVAGYGGWPVSGIRFVIRDKKAEDIRVNGEPLDDHRLYQLAVNDYMANGGDHCDILTALPRRITPVVVRDVLIGYVSGLAREQRPLHPVLENRIRHAE